MRFLALLVALLSIVTSSCAEQGEEEAVTTAESCETDDIVETYDFFKNSRYSHQPIPQKLPFQKDTPTDWTQAPRPVRDTMEVDAGYDGGRSVSLGDLSAIDKKLRGFGLISLEINGQHIERCWKSEDQCVSDYRLVDMDGFGTIGSNITDLTIINLPEHDVEVKFAIFTRDVKYEEFADLLVDTECFAEFDPSQPSTWIDCGWEVYRTKVFLVEYHTFPI